MVRWLLLVLPLVVAAGSMAGSKKPPPAVKAAVVTVALLPLRAEGLQLNEANRLNELLRSRSSTSGLDVQDPELTTQLIEASQALGVHCDVNAVGCGVEMGKLAGVQFVVLGQAVKLPAVPNLARVTEPTIGLDLQLVDVKLAEVTRRIIGRLATNPDQQSADVAAAIQALFATDALAGVDLDVTPAGSIIKLDGIVLGPAPLPTLRGLAVGDHLLNATLAGHQPWAMSFPIQAGQTARIEVRLRVEEAGPKEPPARLLAPPRARERVLVLDFRNDSAREDLVRIVRDSLVAHLSRSKEIDVLSSDDLRRVADLQAQKQAMGCDDSSCLAELAGAVGARYVMFGNVGQLGALIQINISLLDVSTTEMKARDSFEIKSLEQVPQRVRAAAARMFDLPSDEVAETPWQTQHYVGLGFGLGGVVLGAACGVLTLVANEEVNPGENKSQEERAAAQTRLKVFGGLAIGGAATALAGFVVLGAAWLSDDP